MPYCIYHLIPKFLLIHSAQAEKAQTLLWARLVRRGILPKYSKLYLSSNVCKVCPCTLVTQSFVRYLIPVTACSADHCDSPCAWMHNGKCQVLLDTSLLCCLHPACTKPHLRTLFLFLPLTKIPTKNCFLSFTNNTEIRISIKTVLSLPFPALSLLSPLLHLFFYFSSVH